MAIKKKKEEELSYEPKKETLPSTDLNYDTDYADKFKDTFDQYQQKEYKYTPDNSLYEKNNSLAQQAHEKLQQSLTGQTDSARKFQDMLDQLEGQTFSYDVNKDNLYQLYKKQYTQNAKMAMDDTMSRAQLRNGGLGTSYGLMAGQQAYNNYMQQLSDKIPELENLAYQRYQNDRNDLYKRADLYHDLSAEEYNRLLAERDYYTQRADTERDYAWKAEYRAYDRFKDEKSDLYNMMKMYSDLDAQAYSRAADERQWNYGVARDQISDQRYANELAYERSRDALSDARYEDEQAYKRGEGKYKTYENFDEKLYSEYNFTDKQKEAIDNALYKYSKNGNENELKAAITSILPSYNDDRISEIVNTAKTERAESQKKEYSYYNDMLFDGLNLSEEQKGKLDTALGKYRYGITTKEDLDAELKIIIGSSSVDASKFGVGFGSMLGSAVANSKVTKAIATAEKWAEQVYNKENGIADETAGETQYFDQKYNSNLGLTKKQIEGADDALYRFRKDAAKEGSAEALKKELKDLGISEEKADKITNDAKEYYDAAVKEANTAEEPTELTKDNRGEIGNYARIYGENKDNAYMRGNAVTDLKQYIKANNLDPAESLAHFIANAIGGNKKSVKELKTAANDIMSEYGLTSEDEMARNVIAKLLNWWS